MTQEGGPAWPNDEVDRIVTAWQRERPDLDIGPLSVLSRITRLAKHLDRARRAAFAEHDLEAWEFDVLAALRRSGEPYTLSPGALIAQTQVTSGTMTNRIDRMVDHGLVDRMPSPADRRGVLVSITSAGLERVDAAMSELLTVESKLLSPMAPGDQVQLAGLLRHLSMQFES